MATAEKLGVRDVLSITFRVDGKGREKSVFLRPTVMFSVQWDVFVFFPARRLKEGCMPLLKTPVTSGPDSQSGEHQETSHQCKLSGWVTQEHKDKCQKDQLILGTSVKTPIAHI